MTTPEQTARDEREAYNEFAKWDAAPANIPTEQIPIQDVWAVAWCKALESERNRRASEPEVNRNTCKHGVDYRFGACYECNPAASEPQGREFWIRDFKFGDQEDCSQFCTVDLVARTGKEWTHVREVPKPQPPASEFGGIEKKLEVQREWTDFLSAQASTDDRADEAFEKALNEVADPGFWVGLGEELEGPFRRAARRIFDSGRREAAAEKPPDFFNNELLVAAEKRIAELTKEIERLKKTPLPDNTPNR